MNNRLFKPLMFLLVLLSTIFNNASYSQEKSGIGGDFTLTSQQDKPYSLKDARGKVVLMFFGFTHCPDVCPNILGSIKAVLAELGDSADQVKPLFISVDPERDTPEVLSEYVKYFDPSVVGLTGTQDQIDAVVKQYRARYRLDKDNGSESYNVDHTSNLYVIDQQGKLVRIIPYGMPASEILNTVNKLISTT